MDTLGTMVRFFVEGGFFMYPIALVFAIGIAIAIERYIYLSRAGAENRRIWAEVAPLLAQGDFRRAVGVTADSGVAMAQVLAYGLARVTASRRRDDVEKAMEESLMDVVPRLEKRTHYLASFANIATLLGLLGTISGLIVAFSAVGAADPAQRSAFMAKGISTALNATAFGLMIAIPTLILQGILVGMVERVAEQVGETAIRLAQAMCSSQSGASGPAAVGRCSSR